MGRFVLAFSIEDDERRDVLRKDILSIVRGVSQNFREGLRGVVMFETTLNVHEISAVVRLAVEPVGAQAMLFPIGESYPVLIGEGDAPEGQFSH